ncbi:hypothetical protein PAPYR_11249 [Paratrimastix pyriformis]|uniref:Uncharacterized protein n=1 Tax=Paratrimastix pyriformis TaxID=342808 RepID=A0ABQ8U9Y4_9EUKA|nr:hypothetical protein PAPYR_11249 [Paratrimastix pyriformis]
MICSTPRTRQLTRKFLRRRASNQLASMTPLDLLLSVVELSDCPTTTYIQLLGLTHAVRAVIFGTARDLSFRCRPDEGEFPGRRRPPFRWMPWRLSFDPARGPSDSHWWVRTSRSWRRATRAPPGSGDYPILGRVLTALGRGASGGTLRELVLPEIWHPARLAACFQMARSPVLERVSLAALAACGGVGAAVGANLTHLTLHLESDLVGMVGLCRRLVSLDLPIECPGLAALLAANEPTLRDLTLRGPPSCGRPPCPTVPDAGRRSERRSQPTAPAGPP